MRSCRTRQLFGSLRIFVYHPVGTGPAETEVFEPITPLLEIDEIAERIETVLEHSPADETEVTWLEVRRGAAERQKRKIDLTMQPERTVLVRVLDLGRVGSFRTGASEVGQLSDAVRFAMGQSRVREPLSGLPHLPADLTPLAECGSLLDSEIAEMSPKKMSSWLLSLPARNVLALCRHGSALHIKGINERCKKLYEVRAAGARRTHGFLRSPATPAPPSAPRERGAH